MTQAPQKTPDIVMPSPEYTRHLQQVATVVFHVTESLSEETKKDPVLMPFNLFPPSLTLPEVSKLLHELVGLACLKITKVEKDGFLLDLSSLEQRDKLRSFKIYLDKKCLQFPEVVADASEEVQIQTEKKTSKFPEKLKAGTQWKNITIAFKNDREITIHVANIEHNTNFEEMGFVRGKKILRPSASWDLLETLARHNGELFPNDADAKPTFKKQKEVLSKSLQTYFRKEEDPFFPYESCPEKKGRSYKVRFGLFYKQGEKKSDPFADIGEYRGEQSPYL